MINLNKLTTKKFLEMIKYIKFFPIIFILFLPFGALNAQIKQDTSKLDLNQVEVIKQFDAILIDAKRIHFNPSLPPANTTFQKYDYNVTIVPIDINYPTPEIRALAMPTDEPFDINKGFIKAGYGTAKSPSFTGSYHTQSKDKYHGGIYANYIAMDNSQNTPNQKFSELDLDLFGSYVWKENTQINAKAFGDIKTRQLWHEDFQQVDTNFTLKRNISNVGIEARIGNIEKNNLKLNYDAGVGMQFTRISDQSISEQNVYLTGSVQKHRSKYTAFSVDTKLDLTNIAGRDVNNLVTLQLVPKAIVRIKKFKAIVGVNILTASDQSSIFPELNFSYPIIEKNVQLFIGTTQNNFTNSLTNLTKINPFLQARLDSLSNNISKNYFGGIKGEFSFVSYHATAGFKQIKNQALFLNDSTDIRRLRLISTALSTPYFSGNIDFKLRSNVSIGGWLTQNVFNLKTEESAWHLPSLEANAYAKLSLLDEKIRILGELFISDGVPYINFEGNQRTTNILYDLNFKIEYMPVKNVGLYIKGINLLNSTYERWYGYKNIGSNIAGGIVVIL